MGPRVLLMLLALVAVACAGPASVAESGGASLSANELSGISLVVHQEPG